MLKKIRKIPNPNHVINRKTLEKSMANKSTIFFLWIKKIFLTFIVKNLERKISKMNHWKEVSVRPNMIYSGQRHIQIRKIPILNSENFDFLSDRKSSIRLAAAREKMARERGMIASLSASMLGGFDY